MGEDGRLDCSCVPLLTLSCVVFSRVCASVKLPSLLAYTKLEPKEAIVLGSKINDLIKSATHAHAAPAAAPDPDRSDVCSLLLWCCRVSSGGWTRRPPAARCSRTTTRCRIRRTRSSHSRTRLRPPSKAKHKARRRTADRVCNHSSSFLRTHVALDHSAVHTHAGIEL